MSDAPQDARGMLGNVLRGTDAQWRTADALLAAREAKAREEERAIGWKAAIGSAMTVISKHDPVGAETGESVLYREVFALYRDRGEGAGGKE